MGYFALTGFNTDVIQTEELTLPSGIFSALGDIAFYGNRVYMVGGSDTGTWGNIVMTRHGSKFHDYFLAKLGKENLSVVSGIPTTKRTNELSLYPNPTNSFDTVSLPSNDGVISIQIFLA